MGISDGGHCDFSHVKCPHLCCRVVPNEWRGNGVVVRTLKNTVEEGILGKEERELLQNLICEAYCTCIQALSKKIKLLVTLGY